MRRTDLLPIYRELTALERAVIVLNRWKEGKPDDPDVTYGIPNSQVGEYNRLIDLMQATDDRVRLFAVHIEGSIRVLSLQLSCVLSLMLCKMELEDFAAEVAGAVDASSRQPKLEKRLVKLFVRHLRADPDTAPDETPRARLTRLHKGMLVERYKKTSGQLLAAQAFIAQVANEFGGEDPLHPLVRDVLDKAENDLAGIAQSIEQFIGAPPAAKPDEQVLEAFRSVVIGTDD